VRHNGAEAREEDGVNGPVRRCRGVSWWYVTHTWMSHGPWVRSHGTHMRKGRWHSNEWVMACTWGRVGAGGSCNIMSYTYEWVMSLEWVSHGTHMWKGRRHSNEWVMAHTWEKVGGLVRGGLLMLCHTHMNESWPLNEWVMAYTCER